MANKIYGYMRFDGRRFHNIGDFMGTRVEHWTRVKEVGEALARKHGLSFNPGNDHISSGDIVFDKVRSVQCIGYHDRPAMNTLVGTINYEDPPKYQLVRDRGTVNKGDVILVRKFRHISDEFGVAARIISKIGYVQAELLILDCGINTFEFDAANKTAFWNGWNALANVGLQQCSDTAFEKKTLESYRERISRKKKELSAEESLGVSFSPFDGDGGGDGGGNGGG